MILPCYVPSHAVLCGSFANPFADSFHQPMSAYPAMADFQDRPGHTPQLAPADRRILANRKLLGDDVSWLAVCGRGGHAAPRIFFIRRSNLDQSSEPSLSAAVNLSGRSQRKEAENHENDQETWRVSSSLTG